MSVASVGNADRSRIHVLDAATGATIDEFELTGDNAPDRPLIDTDPAAPVGTAVFVSRDEQGRTYILHTPSSGDETSIPTMVYRYDADGTKAFGTPLAGAVHTSLLIEHDGDGGVLVGITQEPGAVRSVVYIANDGSVAWEYALPAGSLLLGFMVEGNHVWVSGLADAGGSLQPWVGQVSLATGANTAQEVFIQGAPPGFGPVRVARAEEGGLDVDSFGNIHAMVWDEHYRLNMYCSPFGN